MLSIIQRERDLTDRLSDNEKKQIQNLLNSIYRKRITDQLYKMVDSTVLYLKNKNKLSNNQWGKFMQFFMDINDLQPEEGIKKFEKYIEKISSKTGSFGSKKTAYEQLKHVKVKEENIIDYFTKVIRNSQTITWLEDDNLKDNFEGFDVEIDGNFAYRMNINFLAEFCRYQLRKEGTI